MSINIETAPVRCTANRIRMCNNNIDSSFNNLCNSVGRINYYWEGRAADHAMSMFYSIRSRFEDERYFEMERTARFLESVAASGYERTENNVLDYAEKFD